VHDVIKVMDAYYLTRDDWDACVELKLGVDVTSALDTKTKTAFTKTYNNSSHPTPFLTQATKIKGGRSEPKPDLEDVVDDDDELQYDDGEAAESSGNDDVSKDKYIVQKPKKTKAPTKPRAPRKPKK
jgi:replication factor C subunit 1